ncbi:hypothetical protein EOD39_16162 [Acipenser ruthenus]|uniref:Uncharacterized protein n=1 Tax=Acipenser ruthenus TaxID=7906 RepID=A0A444V6L1_ACIRT|nr:hypothetical protein EOD39_16162 [Acipenser ruthenus]
MAVRCLFFVFSLSGLLLLIAVVTRTVQSCDSEAGLATYNPQRRQGVMDRVGERRLAESRLNYRGSLRPASQKQMLRVRGRRQAAQLLPLTSQAPPTYPWAIDWGPTLLPEETSDFLSTQEAGQSQQQRHHQRPEQATPTQRPVESERGEERGRERGREGDLATLETDLYETEPEGNFRVVLWLSGLCCDPQACAVALWSVLWPSGLCCGSQGCAVALRPGLWPSGLCCGSLVCAVALWSVLWPSGLCCGPLGCAVALRPVLWLSGLCCGPQGCAQHCLFLFQLWIPSSMSL